MLVKYNPLTQCQKLDIDNSPRSRQSALEHASFSICRKPLLWDFTHPRPTEIYGAKTIRKFIIFEIKVEIYPRCVTSKDTCPVFISKWKETFNQRNFSNTSTMFVCFFSHKTPSYLLLYVRMFNRLVKIKYLIYQ